MPTPVRTGLLLALVAALSFATLGIWGKLAGEVGLGTYQVLAWRFGLVAAALLPLVGRGLSWPQRGPLLGAGVVYVLATFCYFGALGRVTAGATGLLLYLAPAFVILFGWLAGQRPGAARLGAVALAALGLGLVVGVPGAGDRDPLGLALGAGAGALYAAYLLASERWLRGVPPLAATGHLALVGAAAFGALAAARGELGMPEGAAQWGVILGMAALPTLIAVPALYGAVSRLGAARASLLGTLEPLFTVALAFLVLGEPLRPAMLLGGALILAGAALAQGPGGEARPAPAPAPSPLS
ncbi:DMT family transporter [Deinococcus budaensis]|uniref:Drug/metabolite transporter (DMT)-like permease n=1 Tax=Deinococcus budaensis TaxID=1665626 RepID=A0A7W8GHA1_9DEIO|nr:DMT family transporter [Deinococcus budaensis]MBB5235629.1 drug/metabolite transporter (DMT)-like permease [Deinococcus budaensis]